MNHHIISCFQLTPSILSIQLNSFWLLTQCLSVPTTDIKDWHSFIVDNAPRTHFVRNKVPCTKTWDVVSILILVSSLSISLLLTLLNLLQIALGSQSE